MDEITKLIVSEHGKVYEDAKGSLTERTRGSRICLWNTSSCLKENLQRM